MTMTRAGIALTGVVCAVVALSGCAPAVQPSADDARVLSQLSVIAPSSAEIDGHVTGTECWTPSVHLLANTESSPSEFRVLCRVHYEEPEGATVSAEQPERYRDMICIGDFDADPVTDYCYPWAFYTDMPKFEDQPAVAA